MKITMNDSRLTNINQIKGFLKGSQKLVLSLEDSDINEKYNFINKTINRLGYKYLRKKDKRWVIKFIKKITGYKQAQIYRLITRAKQGKLKKKDYKRKNPNHKYSSYDVKLLEQTDELHLKLNIFATKEILRREVELFGNNKYKNITNVSPSHINNLRKHVVYNNYWINHTKPKIVNIGQTTKPENNGIPGSIRIDTVHQRDIYYINMVDEITQWELIVTVQSISEVFLMPVLKYIIDQCPFVVFNFHSDRGSEFINYKVARLLDKLLINQTKSRSRHTNDNALVESKNGTVIRKNMGYSYLSKQTVEHLNEWLKSYFNIYINYHRPCFFQTETKIYKNGRQKAVYGQTTTPYEKLKEIAKKEKKNFLKPKINFQKLDKIAYQYSDNEFAKLMREKERILFNNLEKFNKKFDLHPKNQS